jgi:Caspase domain
MVGSFRRFDWMLIGLLMIGWCASAAQGEDFFLTIAGGYSRSGNQASLEKNVLFFQRMLEEQNLDGKPNEIFFADGFSKAATLQVVDRGSLPKANRFMAEFFGSSRNLGLQYRAHQVPNIRGETSVSNIEDWFNRNAPAMKSGDRLILYVSAHGSESADRKQPYNTTICLWNDKKISVKELSQQLDRLPEGVSVVTFMVQCHAGGFAKFMNEGGEPDKELARQPRCGFFATVHDRPAAGCTPEIDEENYEEYSTYFLAALAGKSRLGQSIEPPDYNRDGVVSFDEAHAYTLLSANTIDLPINTSGEYLRTASQFGSDEKPELLSKNAPFDSVLKLAGPSDRAVLEGLSTQLKLSGDDQIAEARKMGNQRPRGSRGRGGPTSRGGTQASEVSKLRKNIATDLKERWPELANVLNPVSVELLTSRQEEFVQAIEQHKDYPKYRDLADRAASLDDPAKQSVKYERFVRVAENVILAENLRRLGDAKAWQNYERILEAEAGTLGSRPSPESGTSK